jgi:hypothetical protein
MTIHEILEFFRSSPTGKYVFGCCVSCIGYLMLSLLRMFSPWMESWQKIGFQKSNAELKLLDERGEFFALIALSWIGLVAILYQVCWPSNPIPDYPFMVRIANLLMIIFGFVICARIWLH